MSEPANMRDVCRNLTCDTVRSIVIDLTNALNNPYLTGEFAPKPSVLRMRDFCVAYLDEQWPGWNLTEGGKKYVDVPTPVVERVYEPQQASLL